MRRCGGAVRAAVGYGVQTGGLPNTRAASLADAVIMRQLRFARLRHRSIGAVPLTVLGAAKSLPLVLWWTSQTARRMKAALTAAPAEEEAKFILGPAFACWGTRGESAASHPGKHGALFRRPQASMPERKAEDTDMPRTPNYDHERRERDRLKAAKKAEKLAAKAAKKLLEPSSELEAKPTE